MLNNVISFFNEFAKPVVTGGTLTSDATYFYRTFLASGSLVVTGAPLTADILVIAGGGGGGAYNESPSLSGQKRGSAAGAGGLLAFTGQSLAVASHTVTVGAGGAGTTGNDNGTQRNGSLGGDSQFAALTLVKGGGNGVGYASAPGGNGGSGGAGMSGGAGGTATSGQGSNGGAGAGSFSGGGGGATVAGADAVFPVSQGAGGNGSSAYSSWGSVTSTGQNISGTYWYAGGGGNNTAGNGGGSTAGTNATANTGGGGGGDNTLSNGNPSGNGGSGLVIVRYLKTAV
jgi:hypothetical protein